MEKISNKKIKSDNISDISINSSKKQKQSKEDNLNSEGEKKQTKSNSKRKTSDSGNNDSNIKDWFFDGSLLIFNFKESKPANKILSFDLDDTLITTKSGKLFAQTKDDWKFLFNFDNMKKKLVEYLDKGYRLVIFSNQKGIGEGNTDIKLFKSKLNSFFEKLDLPIILFCSTQPDYFRKPSIGGFKLFLIKYNQEYNQDNFDNKDSIYVGDAAGRPKTTKKKKDFADTDYKFALNCGMEFKTPEDFFQDIKEKLPDFEFDIKTYKNINQNDPFTKSNNQEIILFVGSPGSGKTTFFNNNLQNYEHINQDVLKSNIKCLKLAREALKEGKSIVVDRTHRDKESRKEYINLAKEFKIDIRCIYFAFPKDLCFHLNNLRDINKSRKIYSKSVSDVTIHTWFKYHEEPTIKEGFKEVVKLNFIPGPFENKDDEEIFYSYS